MSRNTAKRPISCKEEAMEILAFVSFAALVLVWIVAPSTARVSLAAPHEIDKAA